MGCSRLPVHLPLAPLSFMFLGGAVYGSGITIYCLFPGVPLSPTYTRKQQQQEITVQFFGSVSICPERRQRYIVIVEDPLGGYGDCGTESQNLPLGAILSICTIADVLSCTRGYCCNTNIPVMQINKLK